MKDNNFDKGHSKGATDISAKLLTIDSSTNKSGCAYFCNGKYKAHHLLDCSKDKNMDSRFEEMSHRLWAILEIYKPNIVYVEETVVLRNAQTQRFLTRLQGIIYYLSLLYYVLYQNCCPYTKGHNKRAIHNEIALLSLSIFEKFFPKYTFLFAQHCVQMSSVLQQIHIPQLDLLMLLVPCH